MLSLSQCHCVARVIGLLVGQHWSFNYSFAEGCFCKVVCGKSQQTKQTPIVCCVVIMQDFRFDSFDSMLMHHA
jgi:hypothetical protein